MKRVYRLIIVESIFIMSSLCAACSMRYSTTPEMNSLISEIAVKEQKELE